MVKFATLRLHKKLYNQNSSCASLFFLVCKNKRLILFILVNIFLTSYIILFQANKESNIKKLRTYSTAGVLVPPQVSLLVPGPANALVEVLVPVQASAVPASVPVPAGLKLLVVVCSTVTNFAARTAIRNSWAADTRTLLGVKVVFLVGKINNVQTLKGPSLGIGAQRTIGNRRPQKTKSAKYHQQLMGRQSHVLTGHVKHILEKQLENEKSQHGDIIQEDFVDSYNNLTLKSLALLDKVYRTCEDDEQEDECPEFVLKSDDDMYVNLAALLEVVAAYQPEDRVLLGDLICGAKPCLSRKSKYFVPNNQFAKTTYPPYLGTAYLMSRDTLMDLHKAAQHTPTFPMEDVFVTGILAGISGIRTQDHPGFSSRHWRLDHCSVARTVTTHRVTPEEMVKVWQQLQEAIMVDRRKKPKARSAKEEQKLLSGRKGCEGEEKGWLKRKRLLLPCVFTKLTKKLPLLPQI